MFLKLELSIITAGRTSNPAEDVFIFRTSGYDRV
jgi:hypothetical protein